MTLQIGENRCTHKGKPAEITYIDFQTLFYKKHFKRNNVIQRKDFLMNKVWIYKRM